MPLLRPLAVSPDTYATDAVQSPQRAKYTPLHHAIDGAKRTQKKAANATQLKRIHLPHLPIIYHEGVNLKPNSSGLKRNVLFVLPDYELKIALILL